MQFSSRSPRTWRFCILVVGFLAIAHTSNQSLAEDWLQWGGPNGDFTVAKARLADKWPAEGPKRLWKRPLGEGYSAILCKDGRLFTMFSEVGDEVVVSLNAETGETIWEHRYAREIWPEMVRQFGLGPNATPVIAGDRIVSIGISGQMRCLDVATGKLHWKHDLPAEFGRRKRVEEYGYSNSPMTYEGNIIVPVGGDEHAVVAFKWLDGSVVWKSEPGGISYAAATLTTLAGRNQYIYFSPQGVVGLNPSTGTTLWTAPIEFDNGNHLTPIVRCDDTHIWVGSQFLSGGGRLLEVTGSQGPMQAKQIWFDKKLRTTHWTMIRLDDMVYGSLGDNDVSFLSAFDWKTGKVAWRKRGYHKAQSLYADEKMLFLDEAGKLTIAKVSPSGLEVLGSAQVTEAVSWTLPTLVSDRLYVRDRKNILALDLSK